MTVGHNPSNQREEQDGELSEEIVKAEVERRLGQIEDEPRLRDLLHPVANGGGEGPEPEDAEVPVGKGGEGATEQG